MGIGKNKNHVFPIMVGRSLGRIPRFGASILAGIVLCYTLYRMSMPLKPFIYQAF